MMERLLKYTNKTTFGELLEMCEDGETLCLNQEDNQYYATSEAIFTDVAEVVEGVKSSDELISEDEYHPLYLQGLSYEQWDIDEGSYSYSWQ